MVTFDQRYETALGWLYERQDLGITPGLERVEALLDSIGDPHLSFHGVHVTGTNGKGSVATMLAKALELSGHRTGLYTSPHLVEFEERIMVDGKRISADDLIRHIETILGPVEALDLAGVHASFFEISTALAFLHFADARADWGIIEAGMGGRFDATNVISPDLAIITNVTKDHTTFLGEGLTEIAAHKAGVIKEGTPVVTAAGGEALVVIEEAAAEMRAPVVVVGKDYRIDAVAGGMVLFDGQRERRLQVGPAGRHQLENAALVVAACDSLSRRGTWIDQNAVRRALSGTSMAGRLTHYERDGVNVVVDGAHNVAAIDAVVEHLSGSDVRLDLIVGFNRDKNWPVMLDRLAGLVGKIWAVPVRSSRSLDPELIGSALPKGKTFEIAQSFEQAWKRVVESGSENLLVTGSLFLAGEAVAVLNGLDVSRVGGAQ